MQAADILALDDLQTKSIRVKQWGDTVLRIRELDLEQGITMFEKAFGDTLVMAPEDVAAVLVYGVVDENNQPIFTDKDIPALLKKNRNALMFIYQQIMGLSGGTIKEAEKNLEASQR